MKKFNLVILAVIAFVVAMSCSSQKKCPAYSQINKTEVSKNI